MQELLSRIAAFRNPTTYEAILELSPYDNDQSLDMALEELTDRGLLLFSATQKQYDLHPIVRRFSYEHLKNKREIHEKIRLFFAPSLHYTLNIKHLKDLNPLIEAYHHTILSEKSDMAFSMLRDRLVDSLYFDLGAYQTCLDLLQPLFPKGSHFPPSLESDIDQSDAMNMLAIVYSLSGQTRNAAQLFEMTRKNSERLGDKKNIAIVLLNLVDTLIPLGELASAEKNIGRSIELCRAVQSLSWESIALQSLGRILFYESNFDLAIKYLSKANKRNRRRNDKQAECLNMLYQAEYHLLMSNFNAAFNMAKQARELANVKGYPRDILRAEWLIGKSLVALADEQCKKNLTPQMELIESEKHLTIALIGCRQIKLVELEPDILLSWAKWHHIQGDTCQAQADAEEALEISDRSQYRLKQAEIHNFLAHLFLGKGDHTEARRHAAIAKEIAWCDGPPHCYKPALDEADLLLNKIQA